MNFAKRFLISMLATMISCAVSAEEISRQQVSEFIAAMDRAIENRDADTLEAAIAENAQFTAHVTLGGQVQKVQMGKGQYIDSVRNVWAQSTTYSYRRANDVITFSGRSANVVSDVIEEITVGGQTVRSTSHETATIELVNGKPLLTRVVGKAEM